MLPRVLAVVPVKGRDGKHRLEGLLRPEERASLVGAMLADVLAACDAAHSVRQTLVVTPDPDVDAPGAEVLVDGGEGHAAALARALADDRARAGVLVVMADCPLVTADALDRLAEAARPLAVAPAQDGGLNALALRDPAAFSPAFGVDGAASATLARAREAGLEATVLEEPAFAFDVDRPVDVWRLRAGNSASRAQRLLARLLPPTGGLL